MGHGRPCPLSTERIVKYIANSAAKNMSSLDNQMMVPTLTRFGLLAGVRGTGAVSVTDAVATRPLLRHLVGDVHPTPLLGVVVFLAATTPAAPRHRRTSRITVH